MDNIKDEQNVTADWDWPAIPAPVAETIVQTPTVVNPLLARVHMPGSTFKIPSGGLFYKNGELADDVIDGEVHVQPMTAYDEVLIKTPDLLFSGEAVEKIFKRCIPQIIKPKELFAKDIDFLMICLRKITFGDFFNIVYTHDCEDAKSHEYSIDINHFVKNTKRIDPTTIGSIYTTKINNGQTVKMHPSRFKDVIKMLQNIDPNGDFTPEEETESIIDTIMSVISSVDDIVDKNMIREWLQTIPAGWIGNLSEAIEKTSDWGPDFVYKTKCKDCGKVVKITAPINPLSFFM